METNVMFEKEKSKPRKGDILGVNRGWYWHYGIYAGNNAVIHYDAKNGGFGNGIVVHKTSLQRFAKDDVCQICYLPQKFLRTHKVYSREETLRRALSRMGETDYSIFRNNCEHFVFWCKTGLSKSLQVNDVVDSLSSIPAIGEGVKLMADKEKWEELKMDMNEIGFNVVQGIGNFIDGVFESIMDATVKVDEFVSERLS